MRSASIATIAAALAFGSAASAQIAEVENYIKLASVDPKTVSASDCQQPLDRADTLPPAALFRGAAACLALGKDVEGNFLLSVAQTRGTADMYLMAPAAKADRDMAAGLYGFIFFHAGGPGKEEVFRDAGARDKFFRLLDAWSPITGTDYSADWKVGERPAEDTYRQAVEELKANRRAQLVELSTLLADPAYYALHRKSQELQERTAGSYEVGTPEAELSVDLQRQMAERAKALGIDRSVPDPNSDVQPPETPPSAPGPDETVVASSADAVAQECAVWGDRAAQMSLSKIVRVVITTSDRWGVVWRADTASADEPPARLICSDHGTMIESGDDPARPALP